VVELAATLTAPPFEKSPGNFFCAMGPLAAAGGRQPLQPVSYSYLDFRRERITRRQGTIWGGETRALGKAKVKIERSGWTDFIPPREVNTPRIPRIRSGCRPTGRACDRIFPNFGQPPLWHSGPAHKYQVRRL